MNWSYATSPNFSLSEQWGGPHGAGFNDVGHLPATPAVRRLVIRSGSRVDRMEMVDPRYCLDNGGSSATREHSDLDV